MSATPLLRDVMGPIAREVVETQRRLDGLALQSVEAFGENGVAPSGFAVGQVRVAVPMRAGTVDGRIVASPARQSRAVVAFTVAFRPSLLLDLVDGEAP
jgi:hypothetical protein